MTYSNANFTPSLKGYSNVKPFRFWCQKVLPLVYDDSLSYYELLCKVVDYLNNVISDLSATEDNVGDLLTAYNQLQDYVNNYFTNLDVQEEINTKLDAMFEDGTIPTMIEEYVHPFIETLNKNYAELDTQINATMTTQNENIATLTTRVNNLVINNTTNLTGYNVVTVESTTAQGGKTVTENIPASAEILQVCYSGYNDTNDTIKSDNISYESTPNTPSSTQQQVVVTITDATDTRFNVFITYAVSQDIEIAELTDIRVGYDDTLYSSAGNAVRSQTGNLKNALDSVALGTPMVVNPEFQIGYLHGLPNNTPSNPGHNAYNETICTTDYISVANAVKFYFDSTKYKICIVYYNANKEYQRFASFVTSPNPYILDTQYTYCVPELRKLDESAFTSDDVIDATSSFYYETTINTDIVRHEEFNSAINEINEEIEYIGTKKIIQPDIFPTLPINVYRNGVVYSCDLPYSDLTGFATIYVDSVNGNDSNNGDETHPVKTLIQADYLARVQMNLGNKAIIQIADNSVFYIDDIPASYDAKKSLIVRADHKATIFSGKKPTFTQSGNHYVSESLSSYTIIGCVNTSETDDYGLFKPMTSVESINDVDVATNSYYIDTTNKIVYVNPSSQIDDIVVIFSNKYAMNPAGRLMDETSFFMFENITFVGNSTATARLADTTGEVIKRTIYMKNCVFEHGFNNNGVSFNDFDYTYIIDCICGYAKYDCFNYHFTRKPTPTNAIVVEVNTCGKEGGYYSGITGTSDQISSCHDGANILRCKTHGYNADGSLITDANGCYSVCLDCTVVNTSYIGASGGAYAPYRFDNVNATRNGKTVMQNCYGYDVRNDKLVNAIDLILNGLNTGGSISATNITVGKEMI